MWFLLPANQTEEVLANYLNDEDNALTLRELHVTCCFVAIPDQLLKCVQRCTMLRKLRCVACPFKASDMMSLLLQLPFLDLLHFSLVAQHDLAGEMTKVLVQCARGRTASSLRSMYAEVMGASNFALLAVFLSCCPGLSDLHVHYMSGQLSYAVLYCEEIVEGISTLKNFTFSSDVPASLQLDMPVEVGFKTCLQISSNVTYSQSHSHNYSFAKLGDIAYGHGGADLPPQLVLLAIYQPEHLAQRISAACEMAHWTSVHRLCLVLVPEEPEATHYPTLGAEFFPCLREFFVKAARNLQELNVNSFHFGLDLDLTKVLLVANIKTLRALSTPPCGLRHPSALQRLVSSCPALQDLDVRVYRRGYLVHCAVCESPFVLHDDGVAVLSGDNLRKEFRLTLCDLPSLASLKFLQRCNVTELRLINCPETVRESYAALGTLLPGNGNLWYLQLQQDWLPLCDQSFIVNLALIQSLKYVCLITGEFASDADVNKILHGLHLAMPNLTVAHVHYRRPPEGIEQRITWMRSASRPRYREVGHLLRDYPCIMCCTATFIGLAMPPATQVIFAP